MEYREIKLSELKEINVLTAEPLIKISTPMFILHMILPLFLIFSIIVMTTLTSITPYIFPVILAFSYLVYRMWQLFEPINIIMINKINKSFDFISRNPIKKILVKPNTILFSDIKKFVVSEGSEILLESPRYIVLANIKDGSTIPCFQSNNKITSEKLAGFLNKILLS